MSKDVITRLKAVDEMSGPIGQVMRNVGKFNQQCLSLQGIAGGVSKSLASMATSFMGPAAAVASFTGAIHNSIQTARQFEQELSGLSSLTGMTGSDLDYLKQKAIELGGATTQTATQVLQSFAMIGSKRPDLLQSADALADVTHAAITLAEAGRIDVTQAADSLSAALNIMNMDSSEAYRVINVLAAGSLKGSASIAELSDMIFRAGGSAKSAGIEFETFAAAAEVTRKGFGSAEMAGVALNKLLTRMESKLEDDCKPSVVGFTQALHNLKEKQLTSTEAIKLFTDNGKKAYDVLVNNLDTLEDMIPAMTNTNTAFEQAYQNTNNLEGSLNKLDSAWEQLSLTINASNGPLKTGVDMLTALVQQMSEPMPSMGRSGGFASAQWATFFTDAALRYENNKKPQKTPENKKKTYYRLPDGTIVSELPKGYKVKDAPGTPTAKKKTWDESNIRGIQDEIVWLNKRRKTLQENGDIESKEYQTIIAELTRLEQLKKSMRESAKDPKFFTDPKTLKELNTNISYYSNQVKNNGTEEDNALISNIQKWKEKAKAIQDAINKQEDEAKAAKKAAEEEAKKLDKDNKKIQEDLKKSGQLTSDFRTDTSRIIAPTVENGGKSIGDQYTQGPETNEDKFQQLVAQYDQLNAAIEAAKAKNAESDGAIIDPTAIEAASLQLDGLRSQIEELGPIIQENLNFDRMLESVNNVSSSFSQIDSMVGSVENLANSWANADSALDYFHATMQTVTTALQIFNTVMTTINTIQSLFKATTIATTAAETGQAVASGVSTGMKVAETAATIPAVAANKALTASYLELASAEYMAAHAAIPFVGFAIGAEFAAAAVATTKAIGTKAFAEGGVVPGNSYVGDAVPILANSQEVILNASQQEMLASNLQSAQQNGGGGGRSTISGEQIVTVVNAYGRRTGRGEILR